MPPIYAPLSLGDAPPGARVVRTMAIAETYRQAHPTLATPAPAWSRSHTPSTSRPTAATRRARRRYPPEAAQHAAE
eukprot:scaffold200691_cov33-Tisochrysis_lutea.AAC.6